MKTITYNPETHVLVPREPTQAMCSAALAFENNKPLNEWGMIVFNTYEETYSAMLAAAPQPEPNHNWCAGCSPDNCSGCGAEPVDSEPAMWVMKHIRSGDLAQAKPNQKALHPYMWSDVFPRYTTPQPDRTAELEAALKVARDGIDEFLVANDPTEFGCACDLSVGYLCGPCHADKQQQQPLKSALAKINEVLK